MQGRTALIAGAAGLVGISALSLVYVATAVDDDPPAAEPKPPPTVAREDDTESDESSAFEAVGEGLGEALGEAVGEGLTGVFEGVEPAFAYHDEISRIAVATGRSPRDADVVREAFVSLQPRYPSAVLFDGPPVDVATQADWEAAQWRFIVTDPVGSALCVEVSLDTGPVETSEQLLAIGCRAPGTFVE